MEQYIKKSALVAYIERRNRINSLAVAFLEKQQIQPNIFADQIIKGYKEGYHQAEEDLELTVDDIMKIDALLIDMWNSQSENKYQEVLKRFKENKG